MAGFLDGKTVALLRVSNHGIQRGGYGIGSDSVTDKLAPSLRKPTSLGTYRQSTNLPRRVVQNEAERSFRKVEYNFEAREYLFYQSYRVYQFRRKKG